MLAGLRNGKFPFNLLVRSVQETPNHIGYSYCFWCLPEKEDKNSNFCRHHTIQTQALEELICLIWKTSHPGLALLVAEEAMKFTNSK